MGGGGYGMCSILGWGLGVSKGVWVVWWYVSVWNMGMGEGRGGWCQGLKVMRGKYMFETSILPNEGTIHLLERRLM